jgi:lysophospholipase L1-like esterase/ribonuclease HI
VIALLGVVCWAVPAGGFSIGKWTLRWPTLAEALELTNEGMKELTSDSLLAEADTTAFIPTDSVIPQDTLVVKDSIPKKSLPVIPTVNIANTDTRTYLSAFYAALDSVNTKPVRVVYYGDSQIEEDRITNVLRERWQKEYGGGGTGLLPLHQTIPTRTIRQWINMNEKVQSAQGGPKRYLVYGPRSMRMIESDDYGVMGQVAVMDSALVKGSENIVMNIEPINKKRKPHNYFNRVRVLTDSAYVIKNFELRIKSGDSLNVIGSQESRLKSKDFLLPDSTTKCEIHLQGRGNIYGVSLETEKGVIVDNIPMRGCSGNIFTHIDSAQLSAFYQETNTKLIILQFGGNMIPQTENTSTISGYVRSTLRQQIRYIRSCAPQAAILFIGPSDMSTNIDGQMTTYPLVPYMDKLLKKMAAEEQIAYWSLYDAMGGKDSMVRWVENGLAGSDYVHFTHAGANKMGKTLYNWLMDFHSQPSTSTP